MSDNLDQLRTLEAALVTGLNPTNEEVYKFFRWFGSTISEPCRRKMIEALLQEVTDGK